MVVQTRILIVEDDGVFRKTLVKSLNKKGYMVYGVENGANAIEIVRTHPFDLIIADVRLPGDIDGIDTIGRINEAYPNKVRAIIMTGYADKEAAQRAEKIEVDDYIMKPFELKKLLDSVSNSIKRL